MEYELKTKLADKLYNLFCRQIRSGDFPPGSRFPTVLQIAELCHVSASNAARAVKRLKTEGWIETAPKRGSFVAHKIPDAIRMRSNGRRDAIYFLASSKNEFSDTLLSHLKKEAAVHRYKFVFSMQGDKQRMRAVLEEAEQNAAGFICTHSFLHQILLNQLKRPVVILNGGHHYYRYNEIVPDNYDAGWAVADHLHRCGHSRLGFITSFPSKYILADFHFRERLSGFSDYCTWHRLPRPQIYSWSVRRKNGTAELRKVMEELLRHSAGLPTASAVGSGCMVDEIMNFAKKEFRISDFSEYMSLVSFLDGFDKISRYKPDIAVLPSSVCARESIRLLLQVMEPGYAEHCYRSLISMKVIPGNTVHFLRSSV